MKQQDQLNCRAASKTVVVNTEKGKRLHQMSIMYPPPKDCFDDQVQWREGAFGEKNNLNLISERGQKQSASVRPADQAKAKALRGNGEC